VPPLERKLGINTRELENDIGRNNQREVEGRFEKVEMTIKR
jgi:hypothetical protein